MLPELLFFELGFGLVAAVDVCHLMPDDRGKDIIEHPRSLQRLLQRDALCHEIHDALPAHHEGLDMLELVQRVVGSGGVHQRDLFGLPRQ